MTPPLAGKDKKVENPNDYLANIDPTESNQAIERVADAMLASRAEFLFGAGMSKTRGVADGFEVATNLLSTFFSPLGDVPTPERLKTLALEYPLEAIAEVIQLMPGTGERDLISRLRKALFIRKSDDKEAKEAHEIFMSLCFWQEKPALKRIFTTNFDTYLEEAFSKKAVGITESTYVEIRDTEREKEQKIPIIHLHGTLDKDCRITETHLFDTSYNPINDLLRAALAEAEAFVFVGYSATDPDLRGIYMKYRDEIRFRDPIRLGGSNPNKEDKTTYIVGRCKDIYSYRIGSQIWKSRGAVWIPLTALGFFRKLRSVMERKTGSDILSALKERYAYVDDASFQNKVDAIADVLCASGDDAFAFLNEARKRTGGP
jgi:hypothetical protein